MGGDRDISKAFTVPHIFDGVRRPGYSGTMILNVSPKNLPKLKILPIFWKGNEMNQKIRPFLGEKNKDLSPERSWSSHSMNIACPGWCSTTASLQSRRRLRGRRTRLGHVMLACCPHRAAVGAEARRNPYEFIGFSTMMLRIPMNL